jgi:hypothetical protein
MLMSTHNKRSRLYGPFLFALAAFTGIALGACRHKPSDGDGAGASIKVKSACDSYCAKAKTCKDDMDEQECRSKCQNAMTDCQADEQKTALKRLDDCANESCDDFIGCTINVGATCVFGL